MPDRESLLPRFELKSRRAAVGLCFAILSAVVQLYFGAWYTSVTVFAVMFLLLGALQFRLPEKAQLPVLVLVFLAASCAGFWLTQSSLGALLSDLSLKLILLGILIVAIVLLFFLLLTARPFWSICIGLVLLLFLSTVDFYVYKFRGTEFIPSDILAIKTAGNVAAEYDFTPNLMLVRAWLELLMFLFGVSALHLKKLPRLRLSLVSVPLLTVMVISLLYGMRTCSPSFFMHEGSYLKGFLLNFTLQIERSFVKKPQAYDPDALKTLRVEADPDTPASAPTIIVIMNESYADLGVVGSNFRTDGEVMPFFRSLGENAVKGYACASVFGGGTANSEFEFLTSHSMAFLPSGSIPYQQYLKDDVYSMVSVLKARGYSCVAMTPFFGSGWNIQRVYPAMGFDEMYFKEDFGDLPLLRGFPSDRGMYEYIVNFYEQRDRSRPLFLFGVTMQNHGGFTFDNEAYPSRIHLEGYSRSYPDVEQYLTLIHESDAALAYLIDYFSGVDEDVVLVFFGDHLPGVSSSFYEETLDSAGSSLDEQEKLYIVPYVIWTNYASSSQTPPLTSLNYLENYVYEAAGLPLPAYNQLLLRYQRCIPAINSLGYYSAASGRFLPLSDASGEEADALLQYEQLEYNALFDAKNRLPMFSSGADK